MNTKQIWQALTSNPLTEPYFDGVFPADGLRDIKTKPKLIICNTDPSNLPGKHWLLFFFQNDTVDYYDSLGNNLEYYGKEFTDFVKKFAKFYEKAEVRTQPLNTSLCGYYCLYFAYGKCNGLKMEEIIDSMISASHVINFVNENFLICTNSNCPMLQTCTYC